jgi:hypothetical protein
MVRPSASTLNSLAKLLKEAKPLYIECRSIINYIDPCEETLNSEVAGGGKSTSTTVTACNDEALIPLSSYELLNRRGIQ